MSTDNITVAIKIRPLINREKKEKLKEIWSVQDRSIYQIENGQMLVEQQYCFGKLFYLCNVCYFYSIKIT